MPLSHLLYMSRAVHEWTEESLVALSEDCQRRNTESGLTGLLLHGNGHFLQLLEGRRQPLLLTYDRIRRDDRHTNVTLLLDGAISQRTFPAWAMGVLNVDRRGAVDQQRFRAIVAAFAATPGPMAENATALALLKEFRALAASPSPARLPDLAP